MYFIHCICNYYTVLLFNIILHVGIIIISQLSNNFILCLCINLKIAKILNRPPISRNGTMRIHRSSEEITSPCTDMLQRYFVDVLKYFHEWYEKSGHVLNRNLLVKL